MIEDIYTGDGQEYFQCWKPNNLKPSLDNNKQSFEPLPVTFHVKFKGVLPKK